MSGRVVLRCRLVVLRHIGATALAGLVSGQAAMTWWCPTFAIETVGVIGVLVIGLYAMKRAAG